MMIVMMIMIHALCITCTLIHQHPRHLKHHRHHTYHHHHHHHHHYCLSSCVIDCQLTSRYRRTYSNRYFPCLHPKVFLPGINTGFWTHFLHFKLDLNNHFALSNWVSHITTILHLFTPISSSTSSFLISSTSQWELHSDHVGSWCSTYNRHH